MAIKGLEQAVENLSRISKTAVPGAAAMAINRVASSAISQSASLVARETKGTPETGKGKGQAEKGHGQKSAGQNQS